MATNIESAPALAPRGNFPRMTVGWIGVIILAVIALPCLLTLPWSLSNYDAMSEDRLMAPTIAHPFGTDLHGRSMLWRCLTGGAISLGVGLCAAAISVVIGVTWGAVAGLAGGRVDAIMMRIVDVFYGLPYILLVVLVKIAMQPIVQSMLGGTLDQRASESIASIITLLIAIGGVSWLTMAMSRVMILQESFLSFLSIGVQPPLPSWGNLAAEGAQEFAKLADPGLTFRWWLAFWPCALLGLTLLALNFLGDALRNRLDPRRLKT